MGVVLCAHCIRGEPCIQRNTSVEAATTSHPFLQQTAPIACSLCEGYIRHGVHILVTALFCCDRKARASSAQSFALWQQATIEITHHNHSPHTLVITFNRSHVSIDKPYTPQSLCYCLFVPLIYGCCSLCTLHPW